MRLSGLLWIWREQPPDDPDASELSSRPAPRKPWHWALLFLPSVPLVVPWVAIHTLPVLEKLPAVQGAAALSSWLFLPSCFALGFWWRRRWVGDRFGHCIMAGLAILALNLGTIGAGSFVLFILAGALSAS